MTSLLRELTPCPMAGWASTTMVSRPLWASARATARPTTPAPMTIASTWSMAALVLDELRRTDEGKHQRGGAPRE